MPRHRRLTLEALVQCVPRQVEELRCGHDREIGHDFTRDALPGCLVMGAQIFGQVMRSVALARSVPDHDDTATACCQGRGDLLVEVLMLWGPLALLTRLVLVREVMQEMMRIVGFDLVHRNVVGTNIDLVDPRLVMIHDDQQPRGGWSDIRSDWRARI